MASTLDDLLANAGARIEFTAVIEGFPYVLTSGDPGAAVTAYADSDDFSGYADFVDGVAGLSVMWNGDQRVTPWKPFTEPGIVRLSVVPGALGSTGLVSDVVGETVFKRTGGTETAITAAVDCNDTSITTLRADDFGATGNVYLGPETMAYSSRDTGTDVFTISTRGLYPAFATDTDSRFARTHKPLTSSENDIGIPPLVSSEPRTWVGRWVAIYVHANRDGVLDHANLDGSGAHLAFAGTIEGVEDVDGATVLECVDVRKRIYGTRLNRDPFRARLLEGCYLATGDYLGVSTVRDTTTATGNALTVVAGAPASVNEIQTGTYTVHELAAAINVWLTAERAASRIQHNVTFDAVIDDGSGSRGRMTVVDPNAAAAIRRVLIGGTVSWARALDFMGWNGEIASVQASQTDTFTTGRAPLRVQIYTGSQAINTLAEPRGTWVSQYTTLPADLRDPVVGYDGIVRIGKAGYLKAKRVSDTLFYFTAQGLSAFFPDGGFDPNTSIKLTVDDDVDLDVSQVIVMESTFKTLLLSVLLSTGTNGFNSATYDTLTEPLGCAIPYSILGADFIEEVGDVNGADAPFAAVIDGPVSFHELFNADFVLRRLFFVWGAGRLRLKSWATPSSAYAATTLTEATKASPSSTTDKNRAAMSEVADYFNVVTINHNLMADGKYADSLILRDAVSIREHGERATTINARNTFRRFANFGSPLDDVISQFAGFFGLTSRPWQIVKRSIDFNKFESTYPGVVLSVTDGYIRNPATGLRYSNQTASGGLSGFPGMVVAQSFDWGGVEAGRDGGRPVMRPAAGEVEVMISPRRTIAVYGPCAQVDDTAATSGYVAGTKVLTCYAHEHSEATDVADATRFVAGDNVKVLEIDPSVPGSALSWSDTVASQTGNTITLTTGLAGWDTTKKYRVIFDTYGTSTTTQKAYCYQADDADGLVENTVQAYAFGYFGSSQVHLQTASTGQEVPARYATDAYGDGKSLDVGYERDAARLVNNLINYKTAPQQPTAYSETYGYSGAGTWQLVECTPIFLGMGGLVAGLTRLMSVAPRLRSTTGGTASVRVTLSRRRPSGASRDDVVRVGPYVSATFSTTSTTASISTANTLDISHCKLTDTLLGGVNWLYVEVNSIAEYHGMARCKLGALG